MACLRAEEGYGLEQKPGVQFTAKPDKAASLTEPFSGRESYLWGHLGVQSQVPRRKLSTGLSAFFG